MIDAKTLTESIRGKKILIDSNIIIYLTEKIAPYHQLSRELFSIVEQGAGTAIISILSVAEVMQGPLRSGKNDIAAALSNYLLNFPNCGCQSVTPEVLDCVGQDQRVIWKTLRTMDALIIASGLHAGVDLFVSNDRHFINSIPPEMILSFEKEQ